MLASLVSWSFSLIFSGLLAREVTHRVKGADYRAVGAAAYLGVGSVWALGLSSSAALIMATPASLPDSIEKISGVIPLSQTLGLWQSLVVAAAIIVVSMAISYFSAPPADAGQGHGGDGRHLRAAPVQHRHRGRRRASGSSTARCSRSSSARSGFGYLVREVATAGPGIILDLNHYVFLFLIVGLLLHWRPRSFVQAIAAAITPVGGVLIQYPIYAGIVRMMTEAGWRRSWRTSSSPSPRSTPIR